MFSKADPHALYYANQFLFKTTDDAQTWTQISPDLTRPDPGVPANLDAAAADDTDRNGKRGVIYAIAPSPLQRADGLDRHRRRAHPGHERRRQDLAERDAAGRRRVEPRHDDRSVALRRERSLRVASIAISSPTSIRTSTARATWARRWQEITRGLPAGVYVHVVKEDPARRGLLFAGTERGVFVSFDDGDTGSRCSSTCR